MKTEFKSKFLKNLRKISDKQLLNEIYFVITHVESVKTLNDLQNIKKMSGYKNFYRLRIGNYRIGIEYLDETVIFRCVLHRKDIYREFP
jgi:mRNA interferase RelE/StbE